MATLQVPYTKNISLSVDSAVKIKATPAMPFNMGPEMQVDFYTGIEMDSNIAFQFRVYFGKQVVMNSRLGGNCGEEVKSTVMTFKDGQPFELCISVQSNEYQVSVNGRQCYTFPHRFDPGSVKMIQVWRDVSLTSVNVV
ncbi:placental protein 13-like [Eptesicus fuscus]|uniref:placental protein 13-like n=1 Tax=Eptesicus fuscus TaxID=29078 RepID=UPI00240413C5|nr:placental protein 13-like [Eptesicus fuscus]